VTCLLDDPDRFIAHQTPGAHEWWYFDAISRDGRDALVIIFYSTLPFDPTYHRALEAHAAHPARQSPPDPLDHCAMGISWYHEGKTLAYALNGFGRNAFEHRAEPFQIRVDRNHLERDARGVYTLRLDTPALGPWGRIRGRLRGELRFEPVPGTTPYERDLGLADDPHHWILAAPDNQVEGQLRLERRRTRELHFAGRGYHDHNASASDLARQMRRWHWGRVHMEDETHVYYAAERSDGSRSDLWLTFQDGRLRDVRDALVFLEHAGKRSRYGLQRDRGVMLGYGGRTLFSCEVKCLDNGPFYRRGLGMIQIGEIAQHGEEMKAYTMRSGTGIRELLEPGSLHHPLVRWMIPWRLKFPEKSRF
jgi:hypothetical protein